MGADLAMSMGGPLHTVVAGALVVLALMSVMLLLLAAAPIFTEGVRQRLSAHRDLNLVWSLVYLAGVALAALCLSWLGDLGAIIAVVLLVPNVAFALMGLAVVSVEMGRKIGRLHDGKAFTDLVAFLVGGLAILSASLIPILGWVLLTYFVANGLGAVLRVLAGDLLRRGRHKAAAAPSSSSSSSLS